VTNSSDPFDSLLHATTDALSSSDAPLAGKFVRSLAELPDQRHRIEPATVSACEHLDTALGLGADGMAPLIAAVENIRSQLRWQEMTRSGLPDYFLPNHGYVELIGAEGDARSPDIRLGLYLQAPGIFYPAHAHDAEEFFLVLGGTADWQKDDGEWQPQPPGSFIHHQPSQHHATTTVGEPLLAIWGWTGDIDGDYWVV
jgi:dimethylpropiothetin dethiomethylase